MFCCYLIIRYMLIQFYRRFILEIELDRLWDPTSIFRSLTITSLIKYLIDQLLSLL
jgi:hypothetical protein